MGKDPTETSKEQHTEHREERPAYGGVTVRSAPATQRRRVRFYLKPHTKERPSETKETIVSIKPLRLTPHKDNDDADKTEQGVTHSRVGITVQTEKQTQQDTLCESPKHGRTESQAHAAMHDKVYQPRRQRQQNSA